MKRILMVLMIASLLLALTLPALAQGDEAAPVESAVAFLKTVQNEDGGFTNGFAPESDFGTTTDVVVALALAGEDPNVFFGSDMMNPLAFLGIELVEAEDIGAGQMAKALNAVFAAQKDPFAFAGFNLVDELKALQDPGTGLYGLGAYDHCLSVLALQNVGGEISPEALTVLVDAQDESGGWGFMAGEAPDTNTTALCLQALALLDAPDAATSGLEYLRSIQNDDAGWPYQNPSDFGTESDVNSTALVTQALIALGEELSAWNNPQEWIRSMQLESGAFSYQASMPGDNILATIAAIPALEGVPLNYWALAAADGNEQ